MLMSDLVLDHQRRRQMSEAVGLSFSRAQRFGASPKSRRMGDLAAALGIDRPNATVLVDELDPKTSFAAGPTRRTAEPSW